MSKEEMKRALIAGATSALMYLRTHKNATEEEVMRHVTKEMEETMRRLKEWD